MEAIKRQVGFDGTLQEFFASLRSDPRFLFPNTDEGREGYLQASRDFYAGDRSAPADYFGLRPKGGLVVKRVEAFRELPGAAQHYQQGTPDGSRPGTYYVHLIDMSSMPKFEMESVAYHEGIPGHHMQIAIAQELSGVPTFRTQLVHGLHRGVGALRRAARARRWAATAIPTRISAASARRSGAPSASSSTRACTPRAGPRQQAVDYFLANGPTSEGQVRAEIRRYIVMPGQATAYKVGMLKILELRERARTALGERFDIRRFHDTVLGGGALPLSILERRVDEWVAANSSR